MKTPNTRRRFLLQSGTATACAHLSLLTQYTALGATIEHLADSQGNVPIERLWYSESGSKLLGTFVEFKPTPYDLGSNQSLGKVVLTRSLDQKEFSVSLEKLSEFDRIYVASQLFAAKDIEQFETLHAQLMGLKSEPASSIQVLKEMEKGATTSPYASLWYAVALAVGENQIDDATRANERALKRCQNQREFDPTRHRLTLASVWNNQGILHIKKRKFDLAIADFERAMSLLNGELPVVLHNVATLQDFAESGALFKGQPALSKRLGKLSESVEASGFQSKFSKGWYFSFAIEPPRSATSELEVQEMAEPIPTLELVSMCSGIVAAPGIVITSRQGIIPHNREIEFVTIGFETNGTPTRWSQWTADEVKLIGSHADEKINTSVPPPIPNAAPLPPTTSGLNLRPTAFQIIFPSDTSSAEGQLVVVKCRQLKQVPAPFSDVLPTETQKTLVKGFGRSSDALKNGPIDVKCVVLKSEDKGSYLLKAFNAQSLAGCATVDASYHVIGIHGESRSIPTLESAKEGISYSIETVQKLIQRTMPNTNLPLNKIGDSEQAKKLVNDAIVPLFGWSRRKDVDLKPTLHSKLLDLEQQIDSMAVRDVWCVRCNGTGVIKCPNCKGSGKVVSGYREIVTGRNPVNGQPITQQVLNYVPCSKCKGSSRARCNQCKDGKL
jgi:tetratricopeptide (TPR) repeat protein